MYILPINSDTNQSFSFEDANYTIEVVLKCFNDDRIDCELRENSPSGVIDVFVDGYSGALGLPLLPYISLARSHSSVSCLPSDIGTFHVIPNADGDYDCEAISNGSAAIVYMNSFFVQAATLLALLNLSDQ